MNIYIMRHGKTVWNEQQRIQGRSKNRLSELGKEQVHHVSDSFRGINFDIIFSSPLMRTMQTSNIMNNHHNVRIIKDDRLQEICQGEFTGRFKSSLSENEKELKAQRCKECGMESFEEIVKRTVDCFNEIKGAGYENVLIVTHNYNASIMERIILNQDLNITDENMIRNFKNAEVKEFKL